MENERESFIGKNAKIATVVAVVFGAASGILGSLIEAPSMAIGFWRLTIALPFFGVPIFANGEEREKLKAISKKDLIWCFIGGFFLFAHFFSWFSAVKLTNVASASVLAALHPLVVLLITVFIYRRKVSWKSVVAILIALAGGAVIAFGGAGSIFDGGTIDIGTSKGNAFAFMAGVFMGLYFAVGGSVRKRVSGRLYVFLVFSACWICFIIGTLATGTAVLGYRTEDYVLIAAMAMICQIGSHAVFNMCIGHVSSLYVSTWEAGEPVFSIILGIIFLSQIPSEFEIIGAVVVVLALLYYNRQENSREDEL